MLEEDIREVLRKRDEVLLAYLYGSIVRGHERKESDIDVGLLLRGDFTPDALYPARIGGEIEKKIGTKRNVDVRILNDRSPRFLYQVLKEGRVVLSKDERERVEFESSVVDRYLDFKPYYTQYDEKRKERLLT